MASRLSAEAEKLRQLRRKINTKREREYARVGKLICRAIEPDSDEAAELITGLAGAISKVGIEPTTAVLIGLVRGATPPESRSAEPPLFPPVPTRKIN